MKLTGNITSDYSDEKLKTNEVKKVLQNYPNQHLSKFPSTFATINNTDSKADSEFYEYSLFDSPLKEIHRFLLNYENEEIEKINTIMKSFKHPLIEYLHDNFGYNRSILKLCSWIMQLNKIDITDNEMNDYFWKIMNFRFDANYGKIISKWIEEIDKIEETMLKIIKEVSKGYLTCCICKENQVSILYLPCGHVIICSKCYQITMKQCQICRSVINEVYAIYM